MPDDADDDHGATLAWFEQMVAHTKAAAGLPADWGREPSPLSEEEELEDAPRPALLRSGMTTAELLPYGSAVPTVDGDAHELERLVAGPIVAPHGRVIACDPVSLEWQGVATDLQLRGDLLPVEVAAIRYDTPRGDLVRPCVAVVGDVSAVTSWVGFPDPGRRLSVDKGCGAFVAGNDLDAVAARADGLAEQVRTEGVVAVEVGGRVAGVFVESGDGPGGYELMLGRGRGALPIALLVDFRVLAR